MSWVATAIVGTAVVGAVVNKHSSDKAAAAAQQAAQTQANAESIAAKYMIEADVIPRQFREEALTRLGGLYGMEGGVGSQQELIDQAIQSPLYQQLIANQEFGEEAILRNAAATGGFRSGNVQANLYDYSTRLQNEALTQAYNQQLGGLTGLAGLQTNEGAIANMMAQQGRTLAAGQVAAGQAQQAGLQGIANIVGQAGRGLAGYYGGPNVARAYSDIRAKENIVFEGQINGHNIYSWTWKDEYKDLGLEGDAVGVLAHEVYETDPDAIEYDNGLLMVNYEKLGLIHDSNTH